MADFEIAVNKTIANEGGDKYTEKADDKGGATKYGISLNFIINCHKPIPISGTIDKDKIKNLTIEQAKQIYKTCFWYDNRYGEIEDQDIANKVFDMAVLIGAPQANKILQYSAYMSKSDIDGIIGDKTLSSLFRHPEDKLILYYSIKVDFTKYFLSICNKDKSQEKFLLGWLNRVM